MHKLGRNTGSQHRATGWMDRCGKGPPFTTKLSSRFGGCWKASHHEGLSCHRWETTKILATLHKFILFYFFIEKW